MINRFGSLLKILARRSYYFFTGTLLPEDPSSKVAQVQTTDNGYE